MTDNTRLFKDLVNVNEWQNHVILLLLLYNFKQNHCQKKDKVGKLNLGCVQRKNTADL